MNTDAIALAAKTYNPGSVLEIPEALLISLIGILVVMLELALLAGFILLMAKIFSLFAKKDEKEAAPVPAAAAPAVVPAPSGNPLPDNSSAGKLDLIEVDEPTAAVIMAIVSDKSGIPLNRLNFKSIRKTEDK